MPILVNRRLGAAGPWSGPGRPWRAAVGWGLVLAAFQVLGACAVSGKPPGAAYASLCDWDGWLYARIVEGGYRSTVPPVADLDRCNVMFFPGYPLGSRVLGRLLGLSAPAALLVTSQLAAWGFWTCLLAFFYRWGAGRGVVAAGVTAVLLHPGAFFLVASYSESLFLLGLLVFLYWASSGGRVRAAAGSLGGLVMTATRIAGLPVAVYPVVDAWFFSPGQGFASRCRGALGRFILCLIGLAGGLAFFAYCHVKFGRWDLYLESQRVGWGVEPGYWAVLNPASYAFLSPVPDGRWPGPDELSRLSGLVTLAIFLVVPAVEWRLHRSGRGRGFRLRRMFYLCGLAIFFLHAAGVSAVGMRSLLRYTLATHVLLVLAAGSYLAARPEDAATVFRRYRWPLLLAGAAAGLLQWLLVYRFTHGLWVA